MSWENILKEDDDWDIVEVELHDLDDVLENGKTTKETVKEFCDEITLDFEMQMTMADDDLAWVTDDVKMFAYETIMEELKDVLVDYFDLIL